MNMSVNKGSIQGPPAACSGGLVSAWLAYEFDGHLLVVQQIGAFEDDTKRTLSDLLANTIVDANHIGRRRGHGGGSKRAA